MKTMAYAVVYGGEVIACDMDRKWCDSLAEGYCGAAKVVPLVSRDDVVAFLTAAEQSLGRIAVKSQAMIDALDAMAGK